MSAPETEAKGEAGSAGTRSGVPAAASVERAHHDAPRELDLEAVVAGRLRLGERRLGGAAEALRHPAVRRPACASAARARHGFARDAAEREPRLHDRAVLDAQRRRGRDDREGVGGALAHLQVARMRGETARASAGKRTATISSPGSSTLSRSGVSPGRRWNVSSGISRRPALAFDLDDGIERDQRHAEIGRMGGDAALAPAEHRVQPVLAAAGVAARSRARACCRRWRRRRSRRSASAAADCRRRSRRCASCAEAPDSSASATAGKRCAKVRIVREIGIAHQRADAHAAIGKRLDRDRGPEDGVMSTRRSGRLMPPFIRSSRLVPAAR